MDIDDFIALAEENDEPRFLYLVECRDEDPEYHHSLADLLRLIKAKAEREEAELDTEYYFTASIIYIDDTCYNITRLTFSDTVYNETHQGVKQ